MLTLRRTWLLAFALVCIFLFYYRQLNSEPAYALPDTSNYVHWKQHEERFPVKAYKSLPKSGSSSLPLIQHDFEVETDAARKIRLQRREKVKEAFLHSWNAYKRYAWGKDEITPLSGGSRNAFGGWGATLVDSLDTLWIMGLKSDFEKGVRFVENIDFTTNDLQVVNVFETTIRYLGGMLAAYDLSGGKYPSLLKKSVELGDILYSAFDTPNRMPATRWQWEKSANGEPIEASPSTLIAEIGSLSLEFTRLSQLTKDMKYFDAIQRISDFLEAEQSKTKIPGLWPILVDAKTQAITFNLFTFGGMADSAYEYLPKQHLLLGGGTRQYQSMYETAVDVAKKHLFFRAQIPENKRVLFSGNARASDEGGIALDPQGQHLACFAAGMVGLGSKAFDRPEDMKIARELAEGCIWAYKALPTHLSPETFHVIACGVGAEDTESPCVWNEDQWHAAILDYNKDSKHPDQSHMDANALITQKALPPGFIDIGDARYILRPEALESLFILYRLTGDSHFAEEAWEMFNAITSVTTTKLAHAGLKDVRKNMAGEDSRLENLEDRAESFWLAETLKYAYLAFETPDVVDLGEWVLNTEAHPLRFKENWSRR